MTEQDILQHIEKDEWMMQCLRAARTLDLPDWWIGAGFVRNKVWDVISGKTERNPESDIDLVYFDSRDTSTETEKKHEHDVQGYFATGKWQVRNTARMHVPNGHMPYISTSDALMHWPETATCIGVSMDEVGDLQILTPHGIDDLVNFVVRPSPAFAANGEIVGERYRKWKKRWVELELALVAKQ